MECQTTIATIAVVIGPRGEVLPCIRRNIERWICCVAGAVSDRDYLDKLARAGFVDASIELTRVYSVDDAREFLAVQGEDLRRLAQDVDGKFASGFVRAMKPTGAGTWASGWRRPQAVASMGADVPAGR